MEPKICLVGIFGSGETLGTIEETVKLGDKSVKTLFHVIKENGILRNPKFRRCE